MRRRERRDEKGWFNGGSDVSPIVVVFHDVKIGN
jgi:hypothetical protein